MDWLKDIHGLLRRKRKKMLKEGRLIVPTDPPNADTVLKWVRDYLVAEFGGYTETKGFGGWMGKDGVCQEPVRIFDVAYKTGLDAVTGNVQLRIIADHVKINLQQEAVYVRFNDGSVNLD